MSAENGQHNNPIEIRRELYRRMIREYSDMRGPIVTFEVMWMVRSAHRDNKTVRDLEKQLSDRMYIEPGAVGQLNTFLMSYTLDGEFWNSALDVYEEHRKGPEFRGKFGDPDAGIK